MSSGTMMSRPWLKIGKDATFIPPDTRRLAEQGAIRILYYVTANML